MLMPRRDLKNLGYKKGTTTISSTEINKKEILKEAKKESVKEESKSLDKFKDFVSKSDNKILEIKSFVLFDLFPDKLIIDTERVSVVTTHFFASEKIHSVFISDITDVLVRYTLMFASLTIVDKNFRENEIKVNHLLRKDAIAAREVIEGLLIAKKNGIDTEAISQQADYIEKLRKLGSTTS